MMVSISYTNDLLDYFGGLGYNWQIQTILAISSSCFLEVTSGIWCINKVPYLPSYRKMANNNNTLFFRTANNVLLNHEAEKLFDPVIMLRSEAKWSA
jgi:hypothetical protein